MSFFPTPFVRNVCDDQMKGSLSMQANVELNRTSSVENCDDRSGDTDTSKEDAHTLTWDIAGIPLHETYYTTPSVVYVAQSRTYI